MMPSTPRLLRAATVTPSVGVWLRTRTPTPSKREIVCDNIAAVCDAAHLSQQELGSMLGLSYETVHRIWLGKRNVPADEVWTIASILGLPIEQFFTAHRNGEVAWAFERTTNG